MAFEKEIVTYQKHVGAIQLALYNRYYLLVCCWIIVVLFLYLTYVFLPSQQ